MFDDKTFFDKVYACWMGKNIGGTLGGPLEGRMELMDIKGYTQSFIESVENDDLDLQLVNLHCVEQYGGRADVSLLSREWLEHVHFEYDEYGHSLTNMRRGLGTPLSGCFNNFFTDCMGSPIRSEIWAVICAGMPDLAAYYAYHDASVDHAGGEGVYGEIFFAVLESMAFVETDKFVLIDKALSYLPEESVVRKAVELLLDCYHKGMSWVEARQAIIDRFAGDNFTFAPVNIAFTLVGWLYEEGFTKQMLTTLNCGYDTDCTVATLGSLLGILYGTKYLDSYWTEPLGEKIITSRPITGFDAPKTITELTERSLAARKLVQAHYEQQADKSAYRIPYQSAVEVWNLPIGAFKEHDLEITLRRCVACAPGEKTVMIISVKNGQDIAQELEFIPHVDGFDCGTAKIVLEPGEMRSVTLFLTAPEDKKPLSRGVLEVRRTLGGVTWNSEYLPLSFIPTMDWKYETDAGEGIVQLRENRIYREQLPEGAKKIVLETMFILEDDGPATLKLACANPVKVWVDGEKRIDCPDRTIVIPAYHRADKCKCCDLPEGAGSRRIRIEIGEAESFDELYFMVVSPGFHWAYRIDSVFSI
ncbi:MAG: ADP-ribosylglycohydrolase family protein [Clostridia bacterium]|nr:ADP-ribosylglycohydrolase family protein [Clostridia bacterium]